MREVRYKDQTMKGFKQARILPLRLLLNLGRNPTLDHKGKPHRIASLGSGHDKDCLRYQRTEHHFINSTNPANHRPSTTVRKLSRTGQKPTRGNGGAVGKEDEK